jgi:hypothetical protein
VPETYDFKICKSLKQSRIEWGSLDAKVQPWEVNINCKYLQAVDHRNELAAIRTAPVKHTKRDVILFLAH